MNVKLNISSKIFSSKFYPYLQDWSHRFEFYRGSAGSGKSFFITQKILLRALKEPIRVLVCRRYGTTLRQTVFALFKKVLSDWKLTSYCKIRETDFNISLPNGSEIIFTGLDSEEKLLSLTDITVVFIEEVFEVTQDLFEQLNLRLRGGRNQCIMAAFNPISAKHWLHKVLEEEPLESLLYVKSTYKDNPFLSSEYVAALEELYTRNPAKARIYCDGEWGIDPEGLVFTNWRIEDFNPLELSSKGLESRNGCDEGFTDPSTIVASLYDRDHHRIYIYDLFYKRGCQLSEIADAARAMNIKSRIYCDSASPRLIDFLRREGIAAYPCLKGPDSVQARIAFLQNHELIIHPSLKDSPLVDELSNYSFIKDKQTGTYTDKTTHEYSHSLDALGYGYSDIYTKTKMRTLDKSILGL